MTSLAQTPSQPEPQTSAEPPPAGKVLFSRDSDSAPDAANPLPSPKPDTVEVTDAERESLTFTAYDLDVHLTPATSALSVHAGLTVRNDGPAPLTRLVLQVSSTLRWEAISARPLAGPLIPLHFAVQRLETDADHTGWVTEAVVALTTPLAPDASISLTALYSGSIPASAARLERIGAPSDQALMADWDSLAPAGPTQSSEVALRGFGNVAWYPVAAAPVFLGDGAKLFQSAGEQKLRQSAATIRLRLAVEYVGDPPDAAWFCGRTEHLIALSDNPDLPVAESPGIATAIFGAQPLGFRSPSLFVATHPATLVANGLISAVTENYDALPSYGAAERLVEPLLTEWLGPRPVHPLAILDHAGQPFEDDALLVRPIRAEPATELAGPLVHSLTHAWVHSNYAWIDEGLAQFMSLLWTERRQGRATATAELQDALRALALAEPPPAGAVTSAAHLEPARPANSSSSSSSSAEAEPASEARGQSLVAATSDVYYRTKAAAVWEMLRGLAGDQPLQKALQAYRADRKADHDPEGFERTLELSTQKDLRWFFDDWVYHDRGLPDLSIVNVTPRQMEGRGGRDAGWLVAVNVRNDGDAVADVPVTVRSTKTSETERLRVPGRSSASIRIVFAGTPAEVLVNGGEVPEVGAGTHTVRLVLPTH